MSVATFCFPNQGSLMRFLSNDKLLSADCYKKRGITEAIVKLAVERFAASDMLKSSIRIGIMMIIYDLQNLKGYFSEGKCSEVDLSGINLSQLACVIETVLINYAKIE